MKHLKIAGLCLVSMFVMGMALAGNASAELLWLLCLENPTGTLTKYNSNQCTGAESGGKWQSLGLPSGGSDTVRLLAFSLLLIDQNAGGAGVSLGVHCPDAGTGWGLIEGKKLIVKVAEVTAPFNEGCKLEGSLLTCKESKNITKIKGANLPWTTEMFDSTENKVLTTITGTGGNAGWEITCGGVTDKCVEETAKEEAAELINGVTKGVLLVLARFEEKGAGTCTLGKAKSGKVKGLIAILLWNGNGLSINPV